MTIIDSGARRPIGAGTGTRRTTAPASSAARERIALAPGLQIAERGDHTLQIGIEPPRRILVRHPPPGTAEMLGLVARGVPLPAAIRRVADARRLVVTTWDGLVADLLDGGFLARVPTDSRRSVRRPTVRVDPEPGAADLADTVVVVRGSGRVASSLAALLAAAGVGHVHPDPDRALRPGDAAPAGASPADLAAAATVVPFPGRRDPAGLPGGTGRPAGTADRAALAAVVRRSRPDVSVHRPAGYVRPGLVILATDGLPDPETVRGLLADRQPHLAVRAGDLRGVVGPLVLPGRSSCLHCHDLHRRDSDAGWPQLQLALRRTVTVPPVMLATAIATLAAEQATQFLTGRRPASVDGTIEIETGEWRVRRRSWRAHPGCFCHLR